MIVYFADRQITIIGQASTELPNGLAITYDCKTEDVDTGVAVFECTIPFDKETRSLAEKCTEVGNYVLRSHDGENEFYQIIEVEIDTKKQEIYIYAEDDGMDLLNEVVGAYKADAAYPIEHYIDKYASRAGFEIGINEASDLTRKLSWEGESTAAERVASIATQFDGCEVSYGFDVQGLAITKKYINIYKHRGKDTGVQLRLNKEVDRIVTKKSIANLATALQCTGGTIQQESTVLEAISSGSPQVSYKVDLETASRTPDSVQINARIAAALTSEGDELEKDYGLKASVQIGGGWHSVDIKATDEENNRKWSGTVSHSTEFTFTVSGIEPGVVTFSDIKFKVERIDGKGGSAGVLSSTSCRNFIIPNYIEGGENGENINSRAITLEGYSYDDGDFYVDGAILKSRKALEKWHRLLARGVSGGHIVKLYSNDAFIQETLCTAAITELKKLCEMEVNFEADITELDAKIGDRISIVDDLGELYLSTRILKLETLVVDQEKRATLGEYLMKGSGISQKVIDLAAEFAKQSVAVAKALEIANAAKDRANAARGQADAALSDAHNAQKSADNAQTAADSAAESAQNAQNAADFAQQAVDKVEEDVAGMEKSIADAQKAIQMAQAAAETADRKAVEAQEAAVIAQEKAKETVNALAETKEKAETAINKADAAQNIAEQAVQDAGAAATTAAAARLDAQNAQKEIDSLGKSVTTLQKTMTVDFARKTDLTETEAKLQTQISQNAADIRSTATKFQIIDETANNAAELAAKAQAGAKAAQEEADRATADAMAAQATADQATAAANAAQAEADAANAAADTARTAADQAEQALAAARTDLQTIKDRGDATADEIAAAEQAVATAQTAAQTALSQAEAAEAVAATAQAAADEAVASAQAAQEVADQHAKDAALAQKVADEANGAAVAADVAMSAAVVAGLAQGMADQARAKADAAQAQANEAAQKAKDARSTAETAAAAMQQAEAFLEEAEQRLADVLANVDSTAEEVEEAQANVDAAQQSADEATAAANAASAAANVANANAEEAQRAASEAVAAAEAAQQAATTATNAAEQAQADVNKLAVRVTNAETEITQNAEQIALRATKKELVDTLGGYSTTEETEAAIKLQSDAINLTVNSNYATKQQLEDGVTAAKEAASAELQVKSDEIAMKFESTEKAIGGVEGQVQEGFNELNKYISFTENGIAIGGGESKITLTIDNSGIVFSKNGVPFGKWDGNDFYTGNIVVEVNERAQLGSFAFIPRSDGSLSFLKVGG